MQANRVYLESVLCPTAEVNYERWAKCSTLCEGGELDAAADGTRAALVWNPW